MKILFKKNYILVISPKLTWFCGLSAGTPKLARAAALFPFIIFRSEEEQLPWVINHELIHFRQQIETLFVGLIFLDLFETMYFILVRGKSLGEAYKMRASEQEAYRNQQNMNYLKERKPFALFVYLKDKKEFNYGKPGEIIFSK